MPKKKRSYECEVFLRREIHRDEMLAKREEILLAMGERRKSRVLSLVHHKDPWMKDPAGGMEDPEALLMQIEAAKKKERIDVVLHLPEGLNAGAEMLADALARHEGRVTVMVLFYAMSGGTLLALAADEIVMDENAVLGPVDPQLGEYPAASILKVLEMKDRSEIDDDTLILADIAQKAINQVRNCVKTLLLKKGMDEAKAERITEALVMGHWTHDYPITVEEARKLGLPISTDMPTEIYQLMTLFPQPMQRRPSVQYVPVPYKSGRGERRPVPGKTGSYTFYRL